MSMNLITIYRNFTEDVYNDYIKRNFIEDVYNDYIKRIIRITLKMSTIMNLITILKRNFIEDVYNEDFNYYK